MLSSQQPQKHTPRAKAASAQDAHCLHFDGSGSNGSIIITHRTSWERSCVPVTRTTSRTGTDWNLESVRRAWGKFGMITSATDDKDRQTRMERLRKLETGIFRKVSCCLAFPLNYSTLLCGLAKKLPNVMFVGLTSKSSSTDLSH